MRQVQNRFFKLLNYGFFWFWFAVLCLVQDMLTWARHPEWGLHFIFWSGLGTTIAWIICALVITLIRRIFTRNNFRLTILIVWGILLMLVNLAKAVS